MLQMILKDLMETAGYLPLGIIVGLVSTLLLHLFVKSRKRGYYLFCFLFMVYISVCLMQAYFSREPGSRVSAIDWRLFDTWGTTMREHAYLIENILMFIPFGVLLPLIMRHWHHWQYVIAGALFSLFIEISQLITGRGYCQLDDLVMNTIGALIGVLLVEMVRSILPARVP